MKSEKKQFQDEKKILDMLVLNNGKKIFVNKKKQKIIDSFVSKGYIEKNGKAYSFNEIGVENYLRFYYRPDFIDKGAGGLLGLF